MMFVGIHNSHSETPLNTEPILSREAEPAVQFAKLTESSLQSPNLHEQCVDFDEIQILTLGLPYDNCHHDCRNCYLNFESALAKELKFAFLQSMLKQQAREKFKD
jgi:hypothetical protein